MRTETTITTDQLVTAALELIDEKGTEALSMRALAKRVDRHVSSLYNHVTNRDHLIELISTRIVQDIDVTTVVELPWDAALDAWARMYLETFEAHPNLIQELPTAPVRDRATLQMYETILTVLVQQGWPLNDAVAVVRIIESYVFGTAVEMVAAEATASEVPEEFTLVREALDPSRLPLHDSRPAFERGLEALIDGLRMRHPSLELKEVARPVAMP